VQIVGVIMSVAKRRQLIINRLYASGFVDNKEIAEELGVSVDTIRRDMRYLSKKGLVERTHGGANLIDAWGIPVAKSVDPMLPAKRKIGFKALDLFRQEEAIAIDIGNTTFCFAIALAGHPPTESLTVVTNDFRVGGHLSSVPNITVNLTGGMVGHRSYMWGPISESVVKMLYFDTAFMATSGLTIEEGLTDPNPEVATIKKAMINNAKRVVLLADHTKFGRRHLAAVADLKKIDAIVTDKCVSTEYQQELENRGIRLYIA
jgi:DeoR family fructose operon transcriptional repressor